MARKMSGSCEEGEIDWRSSVVGEEGVCRGSGVELKCGERRWNGSGEEEE